MKTLVSFVIAMHLAAAVAAQTCVQPPTGLVSWYRGEGDAFDSRGINNGSLENGIGFAAGMVGQAFQLDGSDDFVAVPHAADLDITGDLTVDAWVYPTAYGDQRVIVSKRSFNNQDVSIVYFMDTDGRLVFTSRSGGGPFSDVRASTPLPLDQWSFVAVTIQGTTLTFYLNNASDGTHTYTAVRPSNTGRLTIGILEIDPNILPPNGLAAAWVGLLDEVEIFGAAVPAADLLAIYQAGSAGKCRSSVGVQSIEWGRTKSLYR